MGFLTTTVGKKERAAKGHQEVAFPPDMRRCKDNLRIPSSKYSPRECVWRPKSERPTRNRSKLDVIARWYAQHQRSLAKDRFLATPSRWRKIDRHRRALQRAMDTVLYLDIREDLKIFMAALAAYQESET